MTNQLDTDRFSYANAVPNVDAILFIVNTISRLMDHPDYFDSRDSLRPTFDLLCNMFCDATGCDEPDAYIRYPINY